VEKTIRNGKGVKNKNTQTPEEKEELVKKRRGGRNRQGLGKKWKKSCTKGTDGFSRQKGRRGWGTIIVDRRRQQ